METLNADEWAILCFIDEQWLRKHEFPAVQKIMKATHLDMNKVVEAISNPLLQKSLDARGIPWMEVDDRLTEQQVNCINLVMNGSDQRSISMKLKALGINPGTYNGWKRQPHFLKALRDRSEKLYGESLPEIQKSIIDGAIDGDYQKQKLVMAIAGRWDDKKSVESMNIKFVMVKLLEVIQTHVRDPQALQAIAAEFEGLLGEGQKAIGHNN